MGRKKANWKNRKVGRKPKNSGELGEDSSNAKDGGSTNLKSVGVKGMFGINWTSLPKKNAIDAITFHPCLSVNDYYNTTYSYKPLFVHHFFSDSDMIVGFEDIQIHFYYTCDNYDVFMKVVGNIDGSCGHVSYSLASLLHSLYLVTPFPGGYIETEEEFVKILERPQWKPETPQEKGGKSNNKKRKSRWTARRSKIKNESLNHNKESCYSNVVSVNTNQTICNVNSSFRPPGFIIYEKKIADNVFLQIRKCAFSMDYFKKEKRERIINTDKQKLNITCQEVEESSEKDKQTIESITNSEQEIESDPNKNGANKNVEKEKMKEEVPSVKNSFLSTKYLNKSLSSLMGHFNFRRFRSLQDSLSKLKKSNDNVAQANNSDENSSPKVEDPVEEKPTVEKEIKVITEKELRMLHKQYIKEANSSKVVTTGNVGEEEKQTKREESKVIEPYNKTVTYLNNKGSSKEVPGSIELENKAELKKKIDKEGEDGEGQVTDADKYDYTIKENFELLHRKVEWFYHWFIESASNIEYDYRWNIILPYIVFKYNVSKEFTEYSFIDGLNEKIHVSKDREEVLKLMSEESVESADMKEDGKLQQGKKKKVRRKHKLTLPKDYRRSKRLKSENERDLLDEDSKDKDEESRENKSMDEIEEYVLTKDKVKKAVENKLKDVPNGSEKDLFKFHNDHDVIYLYSDIHSNHNNKRDENNEEEAYYFYLFGLATTYTFFTFSFDRNRISQFLIFPQMQNMGLGMSVLEKIYHLSMVTNNIKEITVEDPAQSFRQLRDIITIKLCIDLKILSPSVLYPEDYLKKKKIKKEELPSDKIIFMKICKETHKQITRMFETLMLAEVLPHPAPVYMGVDTKIGASKKSIQYHQRILDPTSMEYFEISDHCKQVRVHIKKRIKTEYVGSLINNSVNFLSSDVFKKYVQEELQKMWRSQCRVYYRTILKLRSLYPL